MAEASVFFYVQHLLGIGHVFRATRVARALAESGMDTHLIWGGTQLPDFDLSGLNVHFLPPVRAGDESFSGLVHPDGQEFTELDKAKRCKALLTLFRDIDPDILITEAFPFGRRQMRFELVPLMEAASSASRPVLKVASIRDIMQENRAEKRVQESLAAVERWYDLVLVHGDPDLIPIEATLQGAQQILDKVSYTGLVLPPRTDDQTPVKTTYDVIVSAGGGAVGYDLMKCATTARQFSAKHRGKWLLIAGSELGQQEFDALLQSCGEQVELVRFLPNLANVLKTAKVSVSRAGYNTVGDLIRAGVPSVLVPFTGGRETEQLRRAEIMDEKGVASLLRPETLDPVSLANAVDAAKPPSVDLTSLATDGATRTAEILEQALARLRG